MERCNHNPYREIFERITNNQQETEKNEAIAPQIKEALADRNAINEIIAIPPRTEEIE